MIEIYEDEVGEYRFRVRGKNHEIVATGEGYSSRAGAEEGVRALARLILAAVRFADETLEVETRAV